MTSLIDFKGLVLPDGSLPTEERYRDLVQALPAAIYTCDEQGRVTLYNDAAAVLWGREPELGKDSWCGSWRIYRPDGARLQIDRCPMAIALQEGRRIVGEEIVIERPDGERRHVLAHPQPIFDTSGAVIGAINLLVDITEHSRAEEALRESQANYHLASQQLAAINENLERRVAERTAQLRALTSELAQTERRERRRLAEVLHDHLQQLLVASKLRLRNLHHGAPAAAHPELEKLDEMLDEAIHSTRSLAVELSPPALGLEGFRPTAEWLLERAQEQYGLVGELVVFGDDADIGIDLKAMLMQALQELLLNVVKHAGVSAARVTLDARQAGWLQVTVADDGKGFDPANGEHTTEATAGFGLFSIKERLEWLGGRMTIESQPGCGTRVTLRVLTETETRPAVSANILAARRSENLSSAEPLNASG